MLCRLVLQMVRKTVLLAGFLLCWGQAHALTQIVNAEIYTLNNAEPWAESFAYSEAGRILAVGSREFVTAELARHSKIPAIIIDVQGSFILPGFQDTHVHVPEAGINESLCLLPARVPVARYEKLIRQCAAEQNNDQWVRAAGVSLYALRNAKPSPLEILDRAMPNRPVMILDDLGHAVWTNSIGLQLAGIKSDDPDPQGGVFHRDTQTGALTGLLLEDAQQRVRNAATPTDDVIYAGLLSSLEVLAENGITTVSDAGGYWKQRHMLAWQRAAAQGEISVRAANSLYLYPSMDEQEQLKSLQKYFDNNANDWLRFDTVKIYIDGILDLGTAAMLSKYQSPPDSRYPNGFSYFSRQQLNRYVNALHEIGYRMEFHVIGDAAVRIALDAVEQINDSPDAIARRRHRTTHTYLVDRKDITRFKTLGVVADFQVGKASTDIGYLDELSGLIGEQAYELLAVDDFINEGVRISISSDWDADPLSPVGIIENALTRDSHAIENLHDAVHAVTLGAAYALGHDDMTGSIEAGKQADYVVLDQNIFDVKTTEISASSVLLTVVGGEEVYRAESFSIR